MVRVMEQRAKAARLREQEKPPLKEPGWRERAESSTGSRRLVPVSKARAVIFSWCKWKLLPLLWPVSLVFL